MDRKRKLQFLFVNGLTFGRIPLILVFLAVNIFLYREIEEGVYRLVSPAQHALWFVIAFAAMVLSALTDLFDGYFARRFKMESKLGAYADPMTDKVFYLVTFPTLVFLMALQDQALHAVLLLCLCIAFLFRDQWVTFLRTIGASYNVSGKANWSGKLRTILSFPFICCLYWYLMAPEGWQILAPWFIYSFELACLAINLVSIWVYTRFYWPHIKQDFSGPGA